MAYDGEYVEEYLKGWWFGVDCFNVKDDRVRLVDSENSEVYEPHVMNGAAARARQQGLWDGLRVNRTLRPWLIHYREELRSDPTLFDRMFGDLPQEGQDVVRRSLAEIDRRGLA